MKSKIKKAEKPQPWKKPQKGLPRWVKAVPATGSHGSGHLQKRLWRLVSDYRRISDWYTYGNCVATGAKISHWTLSDAGHYKSYQNCNGLYKFSLENVHMQSKTSNGWGGQDIGHSFGEELKRRYGPQALKRIEKNNRETPVKFTNEQIVERMKELIISMLDLKDKPKYLDYVVELMGNENL